MPYYRDTESKLHFLEDTDHTQLLPDGCVEITIENAVAICEPSALIKAKDSIVAIEAAQTPRRIREALLDIADKVGADCTFLRDLESKIAVERANFQ